MKTINSHFGKTLYRTHVKLLKVEFGNTKLSDVFFGHSELSKVNFWNAKLSDIAFWNAKLSDVGFTFAELSDVNFSSTQFKGEIDFDNTKLQNYSLTEIAKPDRSLELTKD